MLLAREAQLALRVDEGAVVADKHRSARLRDPARGGSVSAFDELGPTKVARAAQDQRHHPDRSERSAHALPARLDIAALDPSGWLARRLLEQTELTHHGQHLVGIGWPRGL